MPVLDDPPQPHLPVDWRAQIQMAPPKDQGGTQLCMSVALCAAIEARHAIAHGGQQISLAPSFVHQCIGGLPPNMGYAAAIALPAVTQYGIAFGPPDSLPYPNCAIWMNGTKQPYRIQGSGFIRGPNHAKNAIQTRGPIIAEMWLIPSFRSYAGGVYVQPAFAQTGTPGKPFETHVVAVIGFNDAQNCWIIKNSFGPNWGPYGGYGMVAYGSCSLLMPPGLPSSNPMAAFEPIL